MNTGKNETQEPAKPQAHRLKYDYTSSGHLRLTCCTCDRALVKQPYMRGWLDRVSAFTLKEHSPAQWGVA